MRQPEQHSVLSALTQSVLEAAAGLGFDVGALRDEAGLEPALLSDPDARVPLVQHLSLWAALSRRPVGLALGAQLGLSGLGVVGYALAHDQTALDALNFLARHRALIHPDAVPRMEQREHEGERRIAFVQPVPVPFAQLVEPVDAQAAAVVSLVRVLAGADVDPVRVCLQRARPHDTAEHERYHRCPIVWNANAIEVEFRAEPFLRALPRSDARLFGYLARRAEELSEQLPREASFVARAQRTMGELLVTGEPTLGEVAKRLGVSERTLHRRLADEGTRFLALVEEARRERAFLLLGDRSLSASEVASLLGYGEPSTFFRAFRRWTGQTPQVWRKAQ